MSAVRQRGMVRAVLVQVPSPPQPDDPRSVRRHDPPASKSLSEKSGGTKGDPGASEVDLQERIDAKLANETNPPDAPTLEDMFRGESA